MQPTETVKKHNERRPTPGADSVHSNWSWVIRVASYDWVRHTSALRRACGAVLFCAGTIILPAVVTADLVVWLGCRGLSQSACTELLLLSLNQAALAEFAQ